MKPPSAFSKLKKSNSLNSNIAVDPDNEYLRTEGKWFKDSFGRVITLRGVNLSGATKLPAVPCMTTHRKDLFFDHRNISFVGRPFPLEDADEHFARLKAWGFNFLRFIITWEAIEHKGPRQYDIEYFDYVVKILLKAKAYDFKCLIDPHQDVWSRFTGGSGAPGWTLEMVGFNLETLSQTGAAIVQNTYPEPENFPRMIWPTNYSKLACATMFTLFFGGKTFAPRAVVDLKDDQMRIVPESSVSDANLINIQDYLQQHYCNAVGALIEHIGKTEGLLNSVVVGCDTLNEPSGGYLGLEDITEFSKHMILKNGETPTALESMLLGQGIGCDVENWEFGPFGPHRKGMRRIDPMGVRCWKEGHSCIWEQHGLYNANTKKALKPKYFHINPETGKEVDWSFDFWKPFVRLYTKTIRSVFSNAVIFVETPVNEIPPVWDGSAGDPVSRICFTPHWYDGITLMNKHFSSLWTIDYTGYTRGKYSNILAAMNFGIKGIKANFSKQMDFIRSEGLAYIGETPFLLGEFGIPYDMDGKKAYKTGDYSVQVKALDANYAAIEANNMNCTLWNYCADNNNEWGDNWNGEDLSIFSRNTLVREAENSQAKRLKVDLKSLLGSSKTRKIGGRSRKEVKTVDTSLTKLSAEPSSNASVRSEATVGRLHSRCNTSPELTSDTEKDMNVGGRAIAGFLRPYPMKVNGVPISLSFDIYSPGKDFKFMFKTDVAYVPRKHGLATEIFVPKWHFGRPLALHLQNNDIQYDCSYLDCDGFDSSGDLLPLSAQDFFFDVKVSSGTWCYDERSQILHFFHGQSKDKAGTVEISLQEVTITVLNRKEICKRLGVNDQSNFCSVL